MNKQKVKEIFERLLKNNPDPKIELIYSSPFELLIAVILSAQATDVGVNKATKNLFKIAHTPKTILALGEDGLKKYIKTIGLYNSKANNILKLCRILIDRYDSKVPGTREALESLPGVGRKTANIILNTVFGKPVIGVDTHVFRIANRIPLAPGKTPLEVEQNLMEVIPKEMISKANQLLVLHGRYVCTAKKPHCKECVIQDLCEYPDKNL
ncbi:MAG: endonuclease III [Gammaproteobacteria bacterium]|nr:endonuclease III [Gammaproteobacteria bacterium]